MSCARTAAINMSAAQIAGQPFQLEWVQGHAIGNVYWAFLAASPNEFTLLANNDSPADLDAYIDAAPSNQQARASGSDSSRGSSRTILRTPATRQVYSSRDATVSTRAQLLGSFTPNYYLNATKSGSYYILRHGVLVGTCANLIFVEILCSLARSPTRPAAWERTSQIPTSCGCPTMC
jgi:hypothetical protein